MKKLTSIWPPSSSRNSEEFSETHNYFFYVENPPMIRPSKKYANGTTTITTRIKWIQLKFSVMSDDVRRNSKFKLCDSRDKVRQKYILQKKLVKIFPPTQRR